MKKDTVEIRLTTSTAFAQLLDEICAETGQSTGDVLVDSLTMMRDARAIFAGNFAEARTLALRFRKPKPTGSSIPLETPTPPTRQRLFLTVGFICAAAIIAMSLTSFLMGRCQ